MRAAKLGPKTKLGYGVGDLGANLAHQTVSFFLLYFLTSSAGVSPALAGTALMIGKLWDAVTDPLMGGLSDRTHSRFGRRRIYFVIAALPLALSFYLLWQSPSESELGKFWYVLGTVIFYSSSITLFSIPYSALTPEMTSHYHDRTSLTGYRVMFSIVGTLIGAGATPILLASGYTYSQIALVYGVVIVITCILCFLGTKGYDTAKTVNSEKHLEKLKSVLRNRPFRLLVLMFFFNTVAVTSMSANMMYYINDVLRYSGTAAQLPLGVLLVTAMLFVPFWVTLSKKLDKKYCHLLGMLIFIVSILSIYFFGKTSQTVFFSLVIISGFAVSPTYIFNWSMVPDCIEVDELESGQRREGLFYGFWFFAQKLAMACGIWMNGLVLGFTEYQNGQALEQSKSAISGIEFLMGPLPSLFLAFSCIALLLYPITEKRFSQLTQKLDSKRSSYPR